MSSCRQSATEDWREGITIYQQSIVVLQVGLLARLARIDIEQADASEQTYERVVGWINATLVWERNVERLLASRQSLALVRSAEMTPGMTPT
jgi:hypothetical protein